MFHSCFRRVLASPHHLASRRLLATVASDPARVPIIRHNWTRQEIQKIYDGPLLDLVFRAASIHRQNHDPVKIQLCTLMNIKSMRFPLILLDHPVLICVVQPEAAPRTVSDGFVVVRAPPRINIQVPTAPSRPDTPHQPRLPSCSISSLS